MFCELHRKQSVYLDARLTSWLRFTNTLNLADDVTMVTKPCDVDCMHPLICNSYFFYPSL